MLPRPGPGAEHRPAQAQSGRVPRRELRGGADGAPSPRRASRAHFLRVPMRFQRPSALRSMATWITLCRARRIWGQVRRARPGRCGYRSTSWTGTGTRRWPWTGLCSRVATCRRTDARPQGAPPRGPNSPHGRAPGRPWVRPVHLVGDASEHPIDEVELGRRRGCRRRRGLLVVRGGVRLSAEVAYALVVVAGAGAPASQRLVRVRPV